EIIERALLDVGETRLRVDEVVESQVDVRGRGRARAVQHLIDRDHRQLRDRVIAVVAYVGGSERRAVVDEAPIVAAGAVRVKDYWPAGGRHGASRDAHGDAQRLDTLHLRNAIRVEDNLATDLGVRRIADLEVGSLVGALVDAVGQLIVPGD